MALKGKTGVAFLQKFEKFIRTLSSWLEWVGVVALLLMMFITCIDVIGAKGFRRPVFGALDVVMLSQLMAVSFAAGSTLILGRHVKVEFFVILLPNRLRALVEAIVHLIGFGFFILIIWRLFVYGAHGGGEVSATARIPLYPFAYAIAVASIAGCLVFFYWFLRSLMRMVKK